MPPVDIAELERLARAATPGEWHAGVDVVWVETVETASDQQCCGQAELECGGRGCVGPREEIYPVQSQQQIAQAGENDAAYIAAASPATILALVEEVRAIRALVDEQANDDGIWFIAQTGPEAYLQQELRRLHALIEGVTPDDCARSLLARAGEEK